MRWVITQDLETPPDEKNVVGRGSRAAGTTPKARLELAEKWPDLVPFEFRLLDDDGNVYYVGRASDIDFNPLDWAKEFAGCTEIQFKDGDVWKTL
jgi:hypothetical protein